VEPAKPQPPKPQQAKPQAKPPAARRVPIRQAVPVPRPAPRPPFRDEAVSGQKLLDIIRGSIELPDGRLATLGDRVALEAAVARKLVEAGCAEYVETI
jgi:hypothetical protein